MKAGVIVKFSQNVLIGVAAFLISLWWTLQKGAERGATKRRSHLGALSEVRAGILHRLGGLFVPDRRCDCQRYQRNTGGPS